MKWDTIQNSFVGGEFGPSLFGRSDISQYAYACEIVENFIIRPYGSAISAPGSRYVATVSDSTLRTRLIKFVFNRSDAYVIEMGDMYMRFFTSRGQVVTPSGTETLTDYTANLKAHWKCNDNTNSTTVLDAVGTHNGSVSTITTSLSTTAIVSTGFDLDGRYHVSVSDADDFTRTASTQPMTVMGWFYYSSTGSDQCLVSKSGEYELSINSSDELSFLAYSGNTDVKLLLHMNGADGSTVFTDDSPSAHVATAQGNAQIDTAESKFGGASGLFDGTGDWLSIPDSADFSFAGDPLTIDFWVRFNALSAEDGLFSISNTASGQDTQDVMTLRISSADPANIQFLVVSGGSTLINQSAAHGMTTGNWYHIALIRGWGGNANDWAVTVNGSSVLTFTDADSIPNFTQALRIADDAFSGNSPLNGWLDEFRIVKGTAIWTSNFTPSSVPYQTSVSNSWKVDSAISEGWRFIALVFKGTGVLNSDCNIYVDGVLASQTFTDDPSFVRMANTSSLFRIGSTSSAGAKSWEGKIDNIAFIHQELTAVNIASLYTSSAYQIATVFSESEVFGVHFTQLNDVIYLAHPNHPPQELIRASANEWSIADFEFFGGPFLDANSDTTTTLWVSATTGTINITAATGKLVFTRSGSTLGHHNSFWSIGGLAQTNATTGIQEVGYAKITHVINSYTATATVIKNIKSTTATFDWAEGAWNSVRGYPGKVVFHDSRLWFARTNQEPQKIWASKTFEYDHFELDTQVDDDALNLPLASNESNEIQWIFSGKNLIAGTYGGAFVISSGGDDVSITPNNVRADEEVGIGSSSNAPRRIAQFLYYFQRFKIKLREMFYLFDLDSYKAVDRTILSPHILGHGAIEMDVQNNPDPILYCVRTEGTLALMTREVDQEVTSWSRRTTAGTYTSIAIIPSQTADYDEAWYIAERWINGSQKKYVEFFENIEIPERQDLCLYLDSALTYDAYEATSSANVAISLSASSGSVTLTSSTAYFNGGMIGKRIRAINSSGTTLGQGQITATTSTTSITLSITTTFNALSYSAGLWGVSVSSVSGLGHLEAKTVGILADGIKESLTRTVASSAVTLGSNYWVIHVGLSYDQIIYTLPREAGAQRGTAQGKIQRFNEVSLKVNRSTQNFKYGPDSSNLDDVNMAFTPTVTTLYTGILPPQAGGIAMRGGYHRGAKLYIKNSDPLPMEILSIMGSLDTNEK